MPDVGKLDQAIQIQAWSATTNALGEEVAAWTDLGDPRPARLIETPGREFLSGGQMAAEEKAVFVVRWTPIGSKARVLWDDRIWDIRSATGTMREGWRYLHCIAIDGEN